MKQAMKKWTRPQLVILGRGTPEERVLAGCKTSSTGSGITAFSSKCEEGNSGKTCASITSS